jgi:beta-N-acetylhexosaminidase
MKKCMLNKRLLSTALTLVLITTMSIVPSTQTKALTPEDNAAEIVSNMTIEEKVGQMLMPDFRNWNGSGFTVMNDEVKGVIEKYHLGGVILFAENVKGTEQTARLVDGLEESSPKVPLLITIDQEGGIVRRLQTGTGMPGNMALGATRSTDLSYKVGNVIGRELNSLGINVNFGPVLDVNINPSNPVIGVRSFGSDPKMVSDLGVAYIKGVQAAGVAATGKHFPGHGDTATDSHLGLPIVTHDIDTLNKVDLVPFKAAIDNGVDMIMTAHVAFPAVDDALVISKKDGTLVNLPATLSEKVLTGLLRTELGFEGVISTDALNMKAIAEHFGPEESVIMAINAGTDIALMPALVQNKDQIDNLDKVYNAVVNAVETDVIPESKITESATRIINLKIKRGIYDPSGSNTKPSIDEIIANANSIVGSAENKAVEKEAAEKAVTVLKNSGNTLPFKLKSKKKIVLISLSTARNTSMIDTINSIVAKNNLSNVDIKAFTYSSAAKLLTSEQKDAIDSADYVITNSVNMAPDASGSYYDIDYINSVADYTNSKDIKMVNISIRNPYDIMYTPNVKANIAVYGNLGNNPANPPAAPNIPAGINAIFGQINPTGKLPVFIPDATDKTVNLFEFGFGLIYKATKIEADNLITIAKKSLSQKDLDSAKTFVYALPDNNDKTKLIYEITKVQKKIDKVK